MKIACIVVTRGRPHQAVGVIESIRLMSSGEHELEFIVACDDDDRRTYDAMVSHAINMGTEIRISCQPRPAGVAECWNRCVALSDADAFVTLPDDGLIATADWDEGCARIFRNHDWPHPDLKIGAFNDLANPGQPTLFIIGRPWIERFGLFDTRFPFWFSDTALGEIWSFITGHGMPIFPIDFAHKPGHWNPRMRDMALWWRLYGLTRHERLEMADRARRELNLPLPPNMAQIQHMWGERDHKGLPDSEEIVRQIQKRAPVDDRYIAARDAAMAYLRKHGDAPEDYLEKAA